jgi:hypothetical protein
LLERQRKLRRERDLRRKAGADAGEVTLAASTNGNGNGAPAVATSTNCTAGAGDELPVGARAPEVPPRLCGAQTSI